MSPREAAPSRRWRSFELLTVHSLTWLFAGNSVGLLLATLLLFPRLGSLLEPLSYGRFMPVHLDVLLYGWCGLPLAGLLLELYRPRSGARAAAGDRLASFAVGAWSGSLLVGAASWLGGGSSGKLFLDWAGPARLLLAASLGCLAVVLAILFAGQLRERTAAPSPRRGERWPVFARGALLAVLATVPGVLYWASSPKVYPPINPDSSGATGGSLLGSSLVVVTVLYLFPYLVGLNRAAAGSGEGLTAGVLVLHWLFFAALDHGDRSHHEIVQILGLASLGIWWWLLWRHLRRFTWPRASRRWLAALAAWGALLLLDGVITFLPGVLERWKFTNALVAHAHLAMAGMATSLAVLILIALTRRTTLENVFATRAAFLGWNLGNLLLTASLLTLGILEGGDPGLLIGRSATVDALYALRWLAGAMMWAASGRWLRDALAGFRAAAGTLPAAGRLGRPAAPSLVEPCRG
jgi:cytochrome c oxidase cbb3-type subunit 1